MAKRNRSDKSQRDENHTLADEFLDSLGKDKILSNAQDIINSAVNVLEEEIAAGILAAKKIEKEVIDVDKVRDDPDDLMNRIRRDTHDAIDLFMDSLTVVTKHITELSATLKNQNGAAQRPKPQTDQNSENKVSFIEPDKPLKPGESTSLTLTLSDDASDEPVDIKIQKTEFSGRGRQFIYSRAIKVEPSEISLPPGEEIDVTVHINLPKNAEPGTYHALLTDENDHDFRVVIRIEVIEK